MQSALRRREGKEEEYDDAEEDGNIISFEEMALATPSSRLPHGMRSLDLSYLEEAKVTGDRGYAAEAMTVQEDSINVIFDLPDGSYGESRFKLGQTVEVLKSFVESEYGIPMSEQKLYLEENMKMLENPYSLLDYPEVKGNDEIYVRVEGKLPAASRK